MDSPLLFLITAIIRCRNRLEQGYIDRPIFQDELQKFHSKTDGFVRRKCFITSTMVHHRVVFSLERSSTRGDLSISRLYVPASLRINSMPSRCMYRDRSNQRVVVPFLDEEEKSKGKNGNEKSPNNTRSQITTRRGDDVRRWGRRDTRCGINSGLKSSGIQSHRCSTIVVRVFPLTGNRCQRSSS